jgi:cupin fold WbuC family metalloprotein
MKIITRELLHKLTESAGASPRLRKNHNLHPADESCCHRLLNAIEPASYIRPHRHLDPEKDEAFILLSGRLGVIVFSDAGEVKETVTLSHQSGILVADVPAGVFHTAVSLESGTVLFEAKAGPYLPLMEAEFASWAPPEGDTRVPGYLKQLRQMLDS